MAEIPVNGTLIDYPDVGDVDWGTNATNFAIQTSAALGKIGLASGTTVDIPSTLDVTGATTLDSTLTVAGTTNLNGNNNLGNASSDTTAITGILNVDSGVLYVDPTNNRVGINDTAPSEALDVTGNALISGTLGVSGNTTIDGVTYFDDNTTANTPVLSFTGDTNTGIGRSAADTLDFITNGNSRLRIEPTGQIKAVYESTIGNNYNITLHNGYLCRAWVNFDGGSVTNPASPTGIRASGNVSSILDNGTGDYNVNFTTAMPDIDYTITSNSSARYTFDYGGSGGINTNASAVEVAPTTSTFRVAYCTSTGLLFDPKYISVAVFR